MLEAGAALKAGMGRAGCWTGAGVDADMAEAGALPKRKGAGAGALVAACMAADAVLGDAALLPMGSGWALPDAAG